MKQKLIVSLIGIVILIPLGLLSRRVAWIPAETGDALWAMMVFCFWRIILCRKPLLTVAVVSLATAYLVEFSQLITWPWLVSLRSTTLGHLVLGQGFLWVDLLAYTIGVGCIYCVFSRMRHERAC